MSKFPTLSKFTMTSSDVREVLDCSLTWLHKLDGVLQPERRSNGYRRYDPERVLRYLETRKPNP